MIFVVDTHRVRGELNNLTILLYDGGVGGCPRILINISCKNMEIVNITPLWSRALKHTFPHTEFPMDFGTNTLETRQKTITFRRARQPVSLLEHG